MKKNKLFVVVLILCIIGVPTIVLAEAQCPLGEDVTKDLSGALRIARIVAPLLVVGLTFKEGITALFRNDAEGSSKKVVNKLVRRIFAAVLLFVIPVIVDAFMQLLNVWDDTGRCKLDGSGYSNSVQTTESCEQRCGHIGDQEGRYACLGQCSTTTVTTKSETCEQRCGHIGDQSGRNACLSQCHDSTTFATVTNAVNIN